MSERRYTIELTGITPLLMHRDNLDAQDAERERGRDRDKGRAGDDRYPPDRWKSYVYADKTNVVIPADNLMACLREAGKKLKDGRSTLKAVSQYAVFLPDAFTPILVGKRGTKVPATKVVKIAGPFEDQVKGASKLGFDLDVHRCRVQRARHIRVRPRFDTWRLVFPATVTDEKLTEEQFKALWSKAGDLVGLCDWRPGAPQPGSFGRFTTKIKKHRS